MKLLYITANPKPEGESCSLTIGRRFIERVTQQNPEVQIEELHLYNENIPEIDFQVVTGRAALKQGAEYDGLPEDKKRKVDRMNFLCEQFISADRYVIAAPMWSLMFPGRLKNYLDVVIQNGKTVQITPDCIKGLLCDKERRMVYIQSSGGKYSNILLSRLDYGTDYLNVLMKFIGIKKFFQLPVEGTGSNNSGIAGALMNATNEVEDIIDDFLF